MWEAIVDGQHVRPPSPSPVAAGVFRIWESGVAIDEAEFRFLAGDAEWCRLHAPDEPAANPTKRVNLSDLPPDHFLPR